MPFPLLHNLQARFEAFTAAAPPPLAVEIAQGRVAGGRVPAAGTGGLEGLRTAVRPLAAGVVTASAAHANVGDAAALTAALRGVLETLGAEAGAEVTLLLPDLTARLAVLDFDTLPARRDELEPLARFRLRKSLPFAEEQAVISCQALGSNRLLAVFADRARVDEYEDAVEAAGAHAAAVLPSGLAALAAHAALDDGALLLRADSGCLTSAFCRGGRIEFFRALETGGAAGLDDVFPSIAFFRDRCEADGGSVEGALLYTAGLDAALTARLRDETPWAVQRAAEEPATLAVAGALRGKLA